MGMNDISSRGLVRDLTDYILERADTKPSFAESNAAAIIATAVGPDVVVPDKIGDVPLNIFAIDVGGSAVSFKTAAVDVTRAIIDNLSKKLKLNLKLPEKFSIEGLSKMLVERKQGIIVGDEYTQLFSSKSKMWFVDSMEFLSKLWDGYIPEYVTITRGREYVPSVYVNFLSATTFGRIKVQVQKRRHNTEKGIRFHSDTIILDQLHGTFG